MNFTYLVLIMGFACSSLAQAAPIPVYGSASNYFDYSPGGSVSGKLAFSGSNGVDRIFVDTLVYCGRIVGPIGGTGQCSITFGKLNDANYIMDVSYALGGGEGFVKIGSAIFQLQSYFAFTNRVYFDTTPGRLQYEDHYIISADIISPTEDVPEPSSLTFGFLGIASLLIVARLKAIHQLTS